MYDQNQPKKKRFSFSKLVAYLFVASFIFASGYGLGSGRIMFSKDQFVSNTVEENTDLPEDLEYASVEQVYDALRRSYDGELSEESLLEGLKSGLAAATGDPYTEFLNPEAATDFNDQLNGEFTGIGAELSKDEDGNIVVVSPISGFPAEKAGLKPKDIITKVDGESTRGQTLSEVVQKIRGPEGTEVKLTVVRDRAVELEIKITRAKIKIPSVEYEIKDGNIGYLRISRYAEDTVKLSRQAAEEFNNKKVKGVILDLRSNPGGLLDAAVGVSSIWLEQGAPVLKEKRGGVVVKSYTATGSPLLNGVPTVVLINGGSASASEITAGALHDNNAATLIGEKSFGKGSVQRLTNFSDGSVLKVTIARWFTPKDRNIDQEGIEPDTIVEITDEDFKADKDPQLEAAKKALTR